VLGLGVALAEAAARALALRLHLVVDHRPGAEDEGDDLLANLGHHVGEEVERLHLVLHDRVLAPERAEADALLQLVELAQVVGPLLVDRLEHGGALQRLVDLLPVRLKGLVDVRHGPDRVLAVGEVDEHLLDHIVAALLLQVAQRLVERLGNVGALLPVVVGRHVVDVVHDAILPELHELLAVHLQVEGEGAEEVLPQARNVALPVVPLHERLDVLVEHVEHLAVEPLAGEGLAAALVDDLALRVEHVVVLQLALPDGEVVLLHLRLRPLDALVDPGVRDDLALLDAHAVHDLRHPVRAEEAHQVVLEGDVELALARVALAPGTAAQLKVDATAFVALRAQDRQPTELAHLVGNLDVGPAPRHVRRDRDGALLPRLGHDLGLLLGPVLLGVEHVVGNAFPLKGAADRLGHLHRGRAHEHRLAALVVLLDLLDDGVVLLPLRLEDEVVLVVPPHRLVGGDDHHVQVVDLVELLRLRLRRAGHAGQLVVHAEVVLERDGGVGLRGVLNLDLLLRLQRLVEALRVAAPLHDASGVLVDDLYLALLHDVLGVALVQGERL